MKSKMILGLTVLAVGMALMFGCAQKETLEPESSSSPQSRPDALAKSAHGQISAMLDDVNAQLASDGKNYRVAMAEYITTGDEVGNTVIAKNVGNKQLTADFVPFDEGREPWSGSGPGDDITYAVDQTLDAVPVLGGLSAAQTDAAIVRAMSTWEDVNCSTLPIVRNPDFGVDIGYVAYLLGFGGSPYIVADVQHAGFRDLNFAGGVLGVTYTFIWIDDNTGDPTDIDNNGKADVAFREIYYDPSWQWKDDGVSNIDVESVAVHEAGHGLSQAHFGTVFINNNGDIQFAPRAIMNAVYVSPSRVLFGTDNAGHCSNWGDWPNN